jgi:hypothetical protein
MSLWFRMYETVLDDPKVQRLPGDTFKGWVNLLCLAKRHDGVLPEIGDIAFALRLSETEVRLLLETLMRAGLIDDGDAGLTPHNWGGRQYLSDVSTDRVKRFRERERNVSETVVETPPETETETEQNREIDSAIDDEFGVWYAAYPRKQGRGQAIKAYRQARKKADAAVLLAGIERYKKLKPAYADWRMPATWLNGEGWLDQPDAKANGTAPELSGDALWRWRVEGYVKRKFWKPDWGSLPGPGCSAPPAILQEFGLNP